MLSKNGMELIVECTMVEDLDMFNRGNGQPIREALIRQAVQYTDNYASDILYFFSGSSLEMLFHNINYEIDIYFRQNGVDWQGLMPQDHCGEVPKHYRSCSKLVKVGNKLMIYKGYGNC